MSGPAGASPAISVLVADDHPMYRDGMARALAKRPDLRLLGEAGDGAEALALIESLRPDIAIIDLRLPSMDGIAVARAVAAGDAPTRVLIVSAFEDTDTIYRALDAGARGYLTKIASPDALCDAVVAVAGGETVVPGSLKDGAAGDTARARRPRSTVSDALSAREREVLQLTAGGLSAPDIARELFVSVTTVKTHLQHIYDKLGVSDRAAAVAVAARRGLL